MEGAQSYGTDFISYKSLFKTSGWECSMCKVEVIVALVVSVPAKKKIKTSPTISSILLSFYSGERFLKTSLKTNLDKIFFSDPSSFFSISSNLFKTKLFVCIFKAFKCSWISLSFFVKPFSKNFVLRTILLKESAC